MRLLTCTALGLLLLVVPSANLWAASDPWEEAARQIRRLPPSAFAGRAPKVVIDRLTALGCTIPQSFVSASPHNVIRGQFAKRGQVDWAALCSKDGISTIVILWGGRAHCPVDTVRIADKDYLQGIGEGKIGYSRKISAVGRDFIMSHYRAYKQSGAPKPPPIDHEGIEDAFVEKASVVLYCFRGSWRSLQGAD